MVENLSRTTFTTSRLLEFFTKSELSMQMGQSPDWWPAVALKELIDNALDVCENSGVAPNIGVLIEGQNMTITDNAGGIPDAVIKSSLDYMVRVSDKSHYVSPTRGQLGNALKCIYAAPYVLSGEIGRVHIETRGTSYNITIALDRIAQAPTITLDTGTAQSNCTKVAIEWPDLASLENGNWNKDYADLYKTIELPTAHVLGSPTAYEIVAAFAMLNPHAEFTFGDKVWKPTLEEWEKWKPNNPTSPHWYSSEQLRDLIAAYLNAERMNGQPRTVRELVAEFRGLSRTAVQKKVTEDAGLHGAMLVELIKDGDIAIPPVDRLLSSMCEHSKPINPKLLGTIGREHITTRMVTDYEVEGRINQIFSQGRREPIALCPRDRVWHLPGRI